VDFREGRRASDGLVAQQAGAVGTCPTSAASAGVAVTSIPSTVHSDVRTGVTAAQSPPVVAFNSQRLQEAGRTGGIMELHLVQAEHQALKHRYRSALPQDEAQAQQFQHSQYQLRGSALHHSMRVSLPENFNMAFFESACSSPPPPAPSAPVVDAGSGDSTSGSASPSPSPSPCPPGVNSTSANSPSSGNASGAPLQQQLLQHRLLQHKRLQKQGVESRRQMLRQASYKMAQQTQIVPPLPQAPGDVSEFPTIAEDDFPQHPMPGGCGRLLPTVQLPQHSSTDAMGAEHGWRTLPHTLASACHITENAANQGQSQAAVPNASQAFFGVPAWTQVRCRPAADPLL